MEKAKHIGAKIFFKIFVGFYQLLSVSAFIVFLLFYGAVYIVDTAFFGKS